MPSGLSSLLSLYNGQKTTEPLIMPYPQEALVTVGRSQKHFQVSLWCVFRYTYVLVAALLLSREPQHHS